MKSITKMKIAVIVGARPNFIKAAPLVRELSRRGISNCIIHTGQHYDYCLNEQILKQLGLNNVDYYLGIGSGSHTYQTAMVMLKLERILIEIEPTIVVVLGDVNSTLAGALTAVRQGIPVAHVEAGLRSYDRSMPEEINRLITDAISDLLFTPSQDANENLQREGIESKKIHFVGNIMIDALLGLSDQVDKSNILYKLGIEKKKYIYITLHRPNNVDRKERLRAICEMFYQISDMGIKMVFPTHPRTSKNITKFGLVDYINNIKQLQVIDPVGYVDSIALAKYSMVVLTDSGGLQEETTFLGVPCLTLRPNTERPITITMGTNQLINGDPRDAVKEIEKISRGIVKRGKIPLFWDGKAAERIADVILEYSY